MSTYSCISVNEKVDTCRHTLGTKIKMGVSRHAGVYLLVSSITKSCLYNLDPLKPHFYIVKLGFTGVCIIFLISAQKQVVLTSTHNLCF